MMVQDPVCGKKSELADVVASADYDGWAYFFCSDDCRRAFEANPAKFVLRSAVPRQQLKSEASNA